MIAEDGHRANMAAVGIEPAQPAATIGELSGKAMISVSKEGIVIRNREALEIAAGQLWRQQARRRNEYETGQARRSFAE